MAIGTHDFAFLDFPESMPPERVAGMSTASGVSFGQILRSANSAMAAITQNVHPTVSALTYQTDQEEAGDTVSTNFVIEASREYGVAMPQRGDSISHLLPIRKYDNATQFTEEFLDNASERQIAQTLDGLSTAYRTAQLTLTLGALFRMDAVPVTENSASESPKFIGYSANDPAYGRVTLNDGTLITAPYSHYIRDTKANVKTAIQNAVKRLQARGESGPFDILPSEAAAAEIAAMPDFVATEDILVRSGPGTETARVDGNVYMGVLKGMGVQVRHPEARILDGSDDGYFAVFKTYGNNAPDNPVGWRFLPKYGLTPKIRSRSLYPLDYATTICRWGFGTNNRFGAVLVRLAGSGNYTSPQIRS